MAVAAQVDHLVVLAASLEEGVAWCEATLGITPGPGGQHALMGTHNRLFKISSARYPRAYFEIIAIDPAAPAPARTRWFDMDDVVLQERVSQQGPQLAHFVASVTNARAAVAALQTLGIDRGEVLAASRPTPQGLLQWQITVRGDGQRLFDGALPTLIEWGTAHPTHAMAESGVVLDTLEASHPEAQALVTAWRAIGLSQVRVHEGPVSLRALLRTPKGFVDLRS